MHMIQTEGTDKIKKVDIKKIRIIKNDENSY